MAKFFHILIILCLIFPPFITSEANASSIKVAFIRDGYLWIKIDEKEQVLTEEKAIYPYPPLWSFDGNMLIYQKKVVELVNEHKRISNQLWVYDLKTKKHFKIFHDGLNPKWSPTENIVSFSDNGVLNISDLKTFYNIALGVNDYEWQPDGKGFIASSSASLRPDGWTNPVLYTISIANGYQNIKDLTKNVTKFFVIPNEVVKGDVKVPSINAESFSYSPDKQWISFIVTPTASLAMDSDMLCVISIDGKEFEALDEVIWEFTPKWAYNENLLGYIAGGGRIVLGFKNKNLKVKEIPAYHAVNLTPKNYSEMDFSWVNDSSLIVSRVKESEWSNDAGKRPKASLYFLALTGQKQLKITMPPKDKGDYKPVFLPSINKITWIRKSDFASAKGDLWVADTNGEDAKIWIHDIGLYTFFSSQ
ncbi:MAG TPA: TolB domain-containing protein [Sporosarcina psychrophila]|uniref:TolB domain-containing protein n=1 Tax=Sporosarcina psychrophila TaxID=1476 RepID=A0A921KCT6_SPOPS|nr:TolB domain-containing protein [Sporosarcina psychrophila]